MSIRIIYHLSNLIGGVDSTYLDYMDGDSLSDGDRAFVINSGYVYTYELDDDSAAVASFPNIISPATNPGDKRWILQQPYLIPDMSPSSSLSPSASASPSNSPSLSPSASNSPSVSPSVSPSNSPSASPST
jgi:hypothetical protein